MNNLLTIFLITNVLWFIPLFDRIIHYELVRTYHNGIHLGKRTFLCVKNVFPSGSSKPVNYIEYIHI